MSGSNYHKGYWEDGDGSNYHSYGFDPGWPVIASVVRQFLNPGATAYEVACAKGYLVKTLLHFGFNAYGIDISDYAISKADADVANRLQVANAVSLPWPEDTADIILSMEFFEHVPEDEVDIVLSEKMRVLKDGGIMMMKINIIVPESNPHYSSHENDCDVTHYTIKDRDWWENKFVNAGLIHDKQAEDMLDRAFSQRDWFGRFFVWRKSAA